MGKDLTADVGLPGVRPPRVRQEGPADHDVRRRGYAYVGGPCGEGDGGHVHEDWAIVQAVDPATGRDVPDGEWGNLVVTTLDRDNGLLRYDLEEAACFVSRAVRRAARRRSEASGVAGSRTCCRARASTSR